MPVIGLDGGFGVDEARAVGSGGGMVELAVAVGEGEAVDVADGVADGNSVCVGGTAVGWVNVWVSRTGSGAVGGVEVNFKAESMPVAKSPLFVKYQLPIPNRRRSKRRSIHLFFF